MLSVNHGATAETTNTLKAPAAAAFLPKSLRVYTVGPHLGRILPYFGRITSCVNLS
jgi:hypothetical protein